MFSSTVYNYTALTAFTWAGALAVLSFAWAMAYDTYFSVKERMAYLAQAQERINLEKEREARWAKEDAAVKADAPVTEVASA